MRCQTSARLTELARLVAGCALVGLTLALASSADVLRWHYPQPPEGDDHVAYLHWGEDQVLELYGISERDANGVWSLRIPDLCESYEWDVLAQNEHGEIESVNGPLPREGHSFCNGDMNEDGTLGLDDVGLLLGRIGSVCP